LKDNNRSGSESKPGRKPDCYVQHWIGLKDTTWVVGLTMNTTNWSWDVGCRGNNWAVGLCLDLDGLKQINLIF
jgi:hypothetical protein